MRVLHINTKDTGGAAVACIRLHQSLLSVGVSSKLLTKSKTRTDLPEHYSYEEEFAPKLREKARMAYRRNTRKKHRKQNQAFLQSVDPANGPFSLIETGDLVESLPLVQEADIIHLHWVAKFIDWTTFWAACSKKVIIWTLHDMFPFTGGYHYARGFEGFKQRDADYPMLRNSTDPQRAQKILNQKEVILRQSDLDLTVVAPSRWLYQCSQESTLFCRYDHRHIPNGVDTDSFDLKDRSDCRAMLGFPPDKSILLFVSQSVSVQRKGFDVLRKSIGCFTDKDAVVLYSVGSAGGPLGIDHHIPLGVISEAHRLALVYNAADAFVTPTLEDNLPNVVLESLACGTPVIGFDVGGIPDMVKPGFNGSIAPATTAESLYETIAAFLKKKDSFDRQKIRQDAVARYALSVSAEAYQRLYREKIRKHVQTKGTNR